MMKGVLTVDVLLCAGRPDLAMLVLLFRGRCDACLVLGALVAGAVGDSVVWPFCPGYHAPP